VTAAHPAEPKEPTMTRTSKIALALTVASMGLVVAIPAFAADDAKAKFYDFSDQLIDGDIKKPQNIYMESRQRAKFDKLLKLKKSFRPMMLDTSRERLLK